MFGPDSAKETLFGQKIVLCNVNVQELIYKKIIKYLNKHGLLVVECTAEQHDQQIAETLILTHFIGRSLIEFGAKKRVMIDTLGYRRLMKILSTVENDSFQLFIDMNEYNPYSSEMRKKLIASMLTVEDRLK
jgi:prephenate dehydrogenase